MTCSAGRPATTCQPGGAAAISSMTDERAQTAATMDADPAHGTPEQLACHGFAPARPLLAGLAVACPCGRASAAVGPAGASSSAAVHALSRTSAVNGIAARLLTHRHTCSCVCHQCLLFCRGVLEPTSVVLECSQCRSRRGPSELQISNRCVSAHAVSSFSCGCRCTPKPCTLQCAGSAVYPLTAVACRQNHTTRACNVCSQNIQAYPLYQMAWQLFSGRAAADAFHHAITIWTHLDAAHHASPPQLSGLSSCASMAMSAAAENLQIRLGLAMASVAARMTAAAPSAPPPCGQHMHDPVLVSAVYTASHGGCTCLRIHAATQLKLVAVCITAQAQKQIEDTAEQGNRHSILAPGVAAAIAAAEPPLSWKPCLRD